jgi:hypothetical protein
MAATIRTWYAATPSVCAASIQSSGAPAREQPAGPPGHDCRNAAMHTVAPAAASSSAASTRERHRTIQAVTAWAEALASSAAIASAPAGDPRLARLEM